jgi:hypothetical protein
MPYSYERVRSEQKKQLGNETGKVLQAALLFIDLNNNQG